VWLKENLLSTILFKLLKWKTKSSVLSDLQSAAPEDGYRAFLLRLNVLELYDEVSGGANSYLPVSCLKFEYEWRIHFKSGL